MRLALLALYCCAAEALAQERWPQHSLDRPQPPVVTPAPAGPMLPPPADAIVLFDGTSLDNWRSTSGDGTSPARWKVEKGYMEVVRSTGGIRTVQAFGDVQLHIEFMAPTNFLPTQVSQGRGNSGVFLMATYELQVLDSYDNKTYPDGMAGSLYGQFPPLVNAARKPGEWQTYDVVFHRPRFDPAGNVTSRARMTVHWNGILVQDNTELMGPTTHMVRRPYEAHAEKLPITLQDHGDPVRYRNIWVRSLEP